jgi:hypothetical protein
MMLCEGSGPSIGSGTMPSQKAPGLHDFIDDHCNTADEISESGMPDSDTFYEEHFQTDCIDDSSLQNRSDSPLFQAGTVPPSALVSNEVSIKTENIDFTAISRIRSWLAERGYDTHVEPDALSDDYIHEILSKTKDGR